MEEQEASPARRVVKAEPVRCDGDLALGCN